MPRRRSALIAALALVLTRFAPASEPISARHVRPDRQSGTSAAVVVPEGAALAFSKQVVAPAGPDGDASPDRAAAEVLDRLDAALTSVGSGLDRAVRLHVVLDRPELLATLRSALADRFEGRDGPALTVVVGALPRPGAILAADAVAISDMRPDPGRAVRPQTPRRGGGGAIRPAPVPVAEAPAAVLPAGPRVFVSGQADPGDDLAEATRKTLTGLAETLDHLGLGKNQIVQLKAFHVTGEPADSADVVREEVAAFFGGRQIPPLVLVEWQSSLPIEIELVAAAEEPGSDRPIDYLDTPALAASPIFSRVGRVNRGDLVFVSGLFGPGGGSGAAQVEAIFAELAAILEEAGSDLDHLAKATYYVSADDSSQALNDLRPGYYDPSRPPAASKAQVPGVGHENRSITVDMIAVAPR